MPPMSVAPVRCRSAPRPSWNRSIDRLVPRGRRIGGLCRTVSLTGTGPILRDGGPTVSWRRTLYRGGGSSNCRDARGDRPVHAGWVRETAHRRGDDIGGHATGDPGPRTAAGPRPARALLVFLARDWSHLTTRESGGACSESFHDQPVGYGLRRPPRSGHRSARTPGDYRTPFLNKSILRPDPNVLTPRRFATVSIFGNLRGNKRLSRFSLRGQQKVDGQWKLYCLMRNIEKLAHHGSGR